MATMKLTAFNGGMKGKIAGTIFQGGKMGQVVKNAPILNISKGGLIDASAAGSKLTKADAGRGLQVRKYVTRIATKWRTLSVADRLTWNTGAISFPFKNKFGETYTPSGFQVFMSINIKLLKIGMDILNVIPANGGLHDSDDFTTAYSTTGGDLSINFTPPPTGYILVLSATRQLSPGVIVHPSEFADIYQFDGSESTGFVFTDWYVNYFGSLPTHGCIWFRLTTYNNINAQIGNQSLYRLVY